MRHSPFFAFALLTTVAALSGSPGLPNSVLAPLGFAPGVARAQDAANDRTPSRRRASRSRARAPSVVVSFPGFGMNPDGTSRCFVHVAGTLTPETNSSGRRFEVRLPGATVAARNHLNPLETRFFNTPMLRARLVRRGRAELVLVVELRADVPVSMRTEADSNGGTLVVVDLPAGSYVTSPPRIGQPWEDDSAEGGDGSRRLRDGTGSVRPSSNSSGDGESGTAPPRSSVTPSAAPETRTDPAPSNPRPRAAEPQPSPAPSPRPSGTDTERPPMFGQ